LRFFHFEAQKRFQIITQYLFHILWPYRKFGCGWYSCKMQGKDSFLAVHPKKWKRYVTTLCKLCASRGRRLTNDTTTLSTHILPHFYSFKLTYQENNQLWHCSSQEKQYAYELCAKDLETEIGDSIYTRQTQAQVLFVNWFLSIYLHIHFSFMKQQFQ
jgi:hypothetical protein